MNGGNKTILITGGAGYVGKLLTDLLTEKDWVDHLIILDKQPQPKFFSEKKENITYIQENTLYSWQEQVSDLAPNVVVHAAWEIREPYFDKTEYRKQNVVGSGRVFNFAFRSSSVEKLIHFSTVASYGASSENSIDNRFGENDQLTESGYSYADQKLAVEKLLQSFHAKSQQSENKDTSVAVVRPASITGPFGRNIEDGFGLQSALSGGLSDSNSAWFRLIDKILFFTPITSQWMRQFIHEDDVVNIVSLLIQKSLKNDYEVFNLAPPGEVMTGKDMAKSVDKPAIKIAPWLIRFAFFVVWHLSFGKIPTAPGVWKTYSYPIAIDGSKVSSQLGYEYNYNTKEAFHTEEGRFISKFWTPAS